MAFVDSIFQKHLNESPSEHPAVIAMRSMADVCTASKTETLMGIEIELRDAMQRIVHAFSLIPALHKYYTSLSVGSACTLFQRHITRHFASLMTKSRTETGDARGSIDIKQELAEKASQYCAAASNAPLKIASLSDPFFLNDNCVVLVHGFSRAVLACLRRQALRNKRFSVLVTETASFDDGAKMSKELADSGVPIRVIPDSAVYCVMERIDFVMSGGAGVMENGGVVNRVGTAQCACIAKACGKPFYVAVESFKFVRAYPLSQTDVPQITSGQGLLHAGLFGSVMLTTPTSVPSHDHPSADAGTSLVAGSSFSVGNSNSSHSQSQSLPHENLASPSVSPVSVLERFEQEILYDYTPPSLITLLFTDLGVLTPSAVSDELIKLYL